jgi:hypothetical protein
LALLLVPPCGTGAAVAQGAQGAKLGRGEDQGAEGVNGILPNPPGILQAGDQRRRRLPPDAVAGRG